MENKEFILSYLQKFGFSLEEANLYIVLHKRGALTILEAARASEMDRSKLYRAIDTLVKRGLIEELPEYKHKKIRATNLEIIDMLIKQKELENKVLIDSYPTFMESMKSLSIKPGQSNVIYYRGIEGMKQLVWNILKSKDEYHRCFSYSYWDNRLSKSFVLKLNAAMIERNFNVRDIYSDQYLAYKKEWIAAGNEKPLGDWRFWDSRYISEKTLEVNYNLEIYNDVVAYYYWEGDEVFGVEIYNERIAKSHKQMFDLLWKMTKKKPELDWTKPWK